MFGMGNIFMMSDLHLNHEKVARLRGFNTVDDHDKVIYSNISKTVKSGDTVYILGDIAMGPHKMDYLQHLSDLLLDSVTCVILGNHDRPFPGNRNSHLYLQDWMRLFTSVSLTAKLRFAGVSYLLSHFPYDGEGVGRDTPERYTQWRLKDLGTPLIHGHTHDPLRFRKSELGTPQFHCGIDAWNLKPVNIRDLVTTHEELR